MVLTVMLATVGLLALACAAPLSEQHYAEFNARIDALTAQVEGRQRAAVQLPDAAEREDELARLQAVLQVLLLSKAGGALAYMDQDAATLARIEDHVDALLAACPDLPVERSVVRAGH